MVTSLDDKIGKPTWTLPFGIKEGLRKVACGTTLPNVCSVKLFCEYADLITTINDKTMNDMNADFFKVCLLNI